MRSSLIIICTLLLACLVGAQGAQSAEDTKELARLAKLDKAQATAKQAYLKKPKDAKLKKKYVDATTTLAYEVMTSPALSPREKYPRALRLYREAKQVDPKNKDAIKWVKEIEDIYKSMGRPVPPG
jgi:tetratricopeptide (TPR) repeat protein